MEDIMIRATSFQDARKILAKRFHKVWIPIRIGESCVFRFVELEDITIQQKDINYIKAEKKHKSSWINNNHLNN